MTTMITARVDAEKRKKAERVFSEVGLTTSAAVNLFICSVAMNQGIPFPIGLQSGGVFSSGAVPEMPARSRGVKIGIADGKYRFASDFDNAFNDMDTEVSEMFG